MVKVNCQILAWLWLAILAQQGVASTLKCEQIEGAMRILVSDINRSETTIRLYSPNSGKTKEYTLAEGSSASYTTPKGFFDSESNAKIEVQVLDNRSRVKGSINCNYRAPRRTVRSPEVRRGSEVSRETQRPAENGMDFRKIENYADQQARTVANRVVDAYGAREAYKASFVRGFKAAYAANRLFDMGNYQYHRGYAAGSQKANAEGSDIGVKAAQKDAYVIAERDAKEAQMKRASGDFNQYRPQIPRLDYAPVSYLLPQERYRENLKSKINREFESRYVNELKPLYWGSEDYRIGFQTENFEFSLWNALSYDGEYRMIKSFMRDENAFAAWENDKVGSGYDHNLYRKMNFRERQVFKDRFCSIYNRVIEEKLENRARQNDGAAYASGMLWGKQVSDEENFLRGEQDGFNATIANAASTSYNSAFAQRYLEKYNAMMAHYSRNPVIEASFNLTPRRGEMGEIVLDLAMNAVNIGDVDSYDSQLVLSSNNFSFYPISEQIRIAAHERMSISIPKAMVLSRPIFADEKIAINIQLGKIKSSVMVSISFNDLLMAYLDSRGASYNALLKASIISTLEREWAENSGTFQTDVYDAAMRGKVARCYLYDFVNLSNVHPELNELRFAIAEMNRPGAGWHFNKNASFKNLLGK